MLFGAFVNFEGGASVTDTIRFTYQEAGAAPLLYSQTLTTGTEPIDLGFVARFEPVHHTGNLVPTTLTVELLSQLSGLCDSLRPARRTAGRFLHVFVSHADDRAARA